MTTDPKNPMQRSSPLKNNNEEKYTKKGTATDEGL